MKLTVNEVKDPGDMPSDILNYCNDVLRCQAEPMTKIAEKGFRLKVLDNLFKAGYYKYKQSAYVIEHKD
ncbi:hypothetical protein IJJ39_01445 [Candidatus Saccharibacteria bacterium]|nr:hypothetical protein [Candidatus Saccharibacteria bacterium]